MKFDEIAEAGGSAKRAEPSVPEEQATLPQVGAAHVGAAGALY
jgi:hypothetical protein